MVAFMSLLILFVVMEFLVNDGPCCILGPTNVLKSPKYTICAVNVMATVLAGLVSLSKALLAECTGEQTI